MRLVDKHFPRHHKYYKLFNRNNIKLSYSCMPNMNNVIRKHNSKIMKNAASLPPKFVFALKKQTVLWMVNVFLSALFKKHLLVQLLINITMVLVKILSKNVTITITILLEINLVKRTLNCPSIYGNWKRKIWIILLIGILLRKHRNKVVDVESVIYIFLRNSLLQEQILMFCSINVISLPQNVSIETSLLWRASKIDKIFYRYCRVPSDDSRHKTQCHCYMLLLITSYICIFIYIFIYI